MQILVSWSQDSYQPAICAVEQALLGAAQDALSETRAVARQLFGAFAAAWPHRLHDLLDQMRPGPQAKMIQAIATYCPGNYPPKEFQATLGQQKQTGSYGE